MPRPFNIWRGKRNCTRIRRARKLINLEDSTKTQARQRKAAAKKQKPKKKAPVVMNKHAPGRQVAPERHDDFTVKVSKGLTQTKKDKGN